VRSMYHHPLKRPFVINDHPHQDADAHKVRRKETEARNMRCRGRSGMWSGPGIPAGSAEQDQQTTTTRLAKAAIKCSGSGIPY